MRIGKWMLALMALMACGLIAVGCGDDDDDSSSSDEPATEESSDSSTEEADEAVAEGSTPEDVLASCLDVIEGTAAEDAGQGPCEAAADAFEQCVTQSEDIDDEDTRETTLTACQNAVDQAVEALQKAPTAE